MIYSIGSKANVALSAIVESRFLMKDIGILSYGQQTSSLKSFHYYICFFCRNKSTMNAIIIILIKNLFLVCFLSALYQRSLLSQVVVIPSWKAYKTLCFIDDNCKWMTRSFCIYIFQYSKPSWHGCHALHLLYNNGFMKL